MLDGDGDGEAAPAQPHRVRRALALAAVLVLGATLVAVPLLRGAAPTPQRLLGTAGDSTNVSATVPPPLGLVERWRTQLEDAGFARDLIDAAAIGADHVAVGDHVVDVRSGEVVAGRAPGAFDGARFAVVAEDELVLGDARTGEVTTRVPLDTSGGAVPLGPAVAWLDGDPVVQVQDGGSARIDRDGAVVWRSDVLPTSATPLLGYVLADGPLDPADTRPERVVALDADDGTVVARAGPGARIVAATPRSVVATAGGRLLGWRRARLDGAAPATLPGDLEPDWAQPLRGGAQVVEALGSGRVAVVDGPGEDRRARRIDALDGRVTAEVALGRLRTAVDGRGGATVALTDDAVLGLDDGRLRRWGWDGSRTDPGGVPANLRALQPAGEVVVLRPADPDRPALLLRATGDAPLDVPGGAVAALALLPEVVAAVDDRVLLAVEPLTAGTWFALSDGDRSRPPERTLDVPSDAASAGADGTAGDDPPPPSPSGTASPVRRLVGEVPIEVPDLGRVWVDVTGEQLQVELPDGTSVTPGLDEAVLLTLPPAAGPVLVSLAVVQDDAAGSDRVVVGAGWDATRRWERTDFLPLDAVGSTVVGPLVDGELLRWDRLLVVDEDGAEVVELAGGSIVPDDVVGATIQLPTLAGPLAHPDGPALARVGDASVTTHDLATGAPRWRAALPAATVRQDLGLQPQSRVVVTSTAVVVPLVDGSVVALAVDDGRELWRTRVGTVTALTGAGEQVLLATFDGRLVRLDGSGEVVEEQSLDGPTDSLAVVDDQVLAVVGDELVALGPASDGIPGQDVVVVP